MDQFMNSNMSAIVAVCDDWGIGHEGKLLVKNSDDMKSFVSHTTGHTVVMGRKTYETLPKHAPLKNRRNIIMTRDDSFEAEGFEVAHSVDEVLSMTAADDEVWVMGGGKIYELLLPYCKRLVVTKHDNIMPADTFFPNIDMDASWKAIDVTPGGTLENDVNYEFVTYERTDYNLRTCCIYTSKHHQNTLKVLKHIQRIYPSLELIDAATIEKGGRNLDLSEYDLVGFASGIYYSQFDKRIRTIASNALTDNKKVFLVFTSGGDNKWNSHEMNDICRMKHASLIGTFGCLGYDTFGPFKLVGGVQKGCPTEADLARAVDFAGTIFSTCADVLQFEKEQKERIAQRRREEGPKKLNSFQKMFLHKRLKK